MSLNGTKDPALRMAPPSFSWFPVISFKSPIINHGSDLARPYLVNSYGIRFGLIIVSISNKYWRLKKSRDKTCFATEQLLTYKLILHIWLFAMKLADFHHITCPIVSFNLPFFWNWEMIWRQNTKWMFQTFVSFFFLFLNWRHLCLFIHSHGLSY